MTADAFAKEDGNAELWHTIFADGHPALKKQQSLHGKLPAAPRCRMCLVPFASIGGWIMRLKGKRPSSRNHHYCNACDGFLDANPGGAEVRMSVLFADVRNSVATAEGMTPTEVSRRINAFLEAGAAAITDNDGFIMAFYGDCIVAAWPPGFSGPDHAQKAAAAATALRDALRRQHNTASIPVGIGIHTGEVYIGTVKAAEGLFRDVSIFGHSVNVCARLASAAAAGEILASVELSKAALPEAVAVRSIEMKGVSDPVEAVSI